MSKTKSKKTAERLMKSVKKFKSYHFWKKLTIVLLALSVLFVMFMWSVAQWYRFSQRNQSLQLGTSFVPSYARYFGLDPKETFNEILTDLNIKNLRLVSYWNIGEKEQGKYDFEDLDWQFKMAEEHGAKISLSLGLRQPRWPECHMPDWAKNMPDKSWYPHLYDYIEKVVLRYKDSPVLDSYQLENEYFLKGFGICENFDRQRLVDEFNLVKSLDPNRKLIVTMSNNAIGMPIGEPTPDQWAIAVYKRVWDKSLTRRYFEYPIPAWYYAFRAGFTQLTRGRESFIHELQTEPWIAEGKGQLKESTIEEQDKTIDANRLEERINYGKATGMRKIDLWGAEWWYWRKVKFNDPSLWNVVKSEAAKIKATNKD